MVESERHVSAKLRQLYRDVVKILKYVSEEIVYAVARHVKDSAIAKTGIHDYKSQLEPRESCRFRRLSYTIGMCEVVKHNVIHKRTRS